MNRILTEEEILLELERSDPDILDFEDSSDNEGEIDYVEEDDVAEDNFSPDATDDEYVPEPESEEEEIQDRVVMRKRRRIRNDRNDVQVGTFNDACTSDTNVQNVDEEETPQNVPDNIVVPDKVSLHGKNKYRWSSEPPSRMGRTPKRNSYNSVSARRSCKRCEK